MSKSTKKTKKALAITGTILGIGAAIAGTLFMKDKKNRDKVKKVISTAKNKIKKTSSKKTSSKKSKK